MIDFKLNSDNSDIFFDGTGNFATISGKDEAIQSIKIAFRTWLYDYDFDTELGIDWKGILESQYTQSEIEELINIYISTITTIDNVIVNLTINDSVVTISIICNYIETQENINVNI